VLMTTFFYRSVLATGLWGCFGIRALVQAQPAKPRPAPPNIYQAIDDKMAHVPDSSTRTAGGLARYINASFSTEDDKARAAFVWVAKNIRYDAEDPYNIVFFREPADVIREALDQRVGVCVQYAELYSAVANLVGVVTYVVPGYTKQRDGTVASVGHAWCASRIAGRWYLLDPTWSAGYVVEDKYVPRFSNEFFRAPPAVFIRNHMPFDPLWQLLPAPRTALQFQKGTASVPPLPPLFSFADSLAAYERQSPIQQLRATNRRIEQHGVKNGLTYSFLVDNKQRELSQYFTAYNDGVNVFNAAVDKLNTHVEYQNRQFQPKKTDAELQALLPPIAADFARARNLTAAVPATDPSQQTSAEQFQKTLRAAETRLQESQAFMTRYLQANRLMRPLLFLNPSGRNPMMR